MENIKVVSKTGEMPGMTAVILSGVHGNEFCGVRAFDNVIPKLKIKSGRVIFIYSNLNAIELNKRCIDRDLNRCFFEEQPEKIECTLEGRTAKEIIPFLDEADVLLDIHASNTPNSQPFVICDKIDFRDSKMFSLGLSVCGFKELESGTSGSYMANQKKKWFAVECGYAKDELSQNIAERAIIDFLVHFGFVDGERKPEVKHDFVRLNGLYKNKFGPFRTAQDFKDFQKIKKRTLVGFDGDEEVCIDKGNLILFVRNRDNLNEECFLTAELI